MVQNTLTRLHGSWVSQGNGVLATLNDVWHNNGAIFDNARGQAAIDFGMNAYEVFVEGWGKGGPGGAAVECLHKVMLAGVEYGTGSDGTGVLDFSKYNATTMQQEANEQYGADLSSPTSLAEITKMAINRGIEDGLARHARDFGNRTLGVAIQRSQVEAFRGGMQASLRQGLYSGGPAFANTLQNDMNRLAAARKKLSGLKIADAYKGADFLKSGLKDVIKTAAKSYFQAQENSVWEQLMLDDALARQANTVYRYHNELYWGMSDALDELKRQRANLIAGYDPRTGFKLVKNEAFDDDDDVGIHIQLRQPAGHREEVVLGNLPASPSSAHSFGLQAKDIEGADGAALTLLVKQH